MSLVTDFYAKQLLPLLASDLQQVGKPVPDYATLLAIATAIVEDLEGRHIPLNSPALSYAAFAYANNPQLTAGGAQPVNADLSARLHNLAAADLVPIARSAIAARRGNTPDLDAKAIDVASKLAAHLKQLV